MFLETRICPILSGGASACLISNSSLLMVAFKPSKAFFSLAGVEESACSILAASASGASVRLLKVFLRFLAELFDIANDLHFQAGNHLYPQQVISFVTILIFSPEIFKFKRVLKHSTSGYHHFLLWFKVL
jgi:hypothetical protein